MNALKPRTIKEMVEKEGLCLTELTKAGSGHFRARVGAKDGRSTMMFFPTTPSDYRGLLNKRSDLRRFAAGAVHALGSHHAACAAA